MHVCLLSKPTCLYFHSLCYVVVRSVNDISLLLKVVNFLSEARVIWSNIAGCKRGDECFNTMDNSFTITDRLFTISEPEDFYELALLRSDTLCRYVHNCACYLCTSIHVVQWNPSKPDPLFNGFPLYRTWPVVPNLLIDNTLYITPLNWIPSKPNIMSGPEGVRLRGISLYIFNHPLCYKL